MSFFDLENIRFTELLLLTFKEEYVYTMYLIIGITICYYVIRPIISFFTYWRLNKLLTYLGSSLFVLAAFHFFFEDTDLLLILFKNMFRCLAYFGLLLFIIESYRQLRNPNT